MCSVHADADAAYARYSAARADVLKAVAELASTDAWRGDGATDLAAWLSPRWQISIREAREVVREAEALVARPALAQALGAGAISIDQCKALTVLCREGTDDDELWLEALPLWSLPELEREARKQIARELERRDDGTYFRVRHTADERYMRGEFQLHPEDGAALMSAIEGRVPNGTPLRDWDRASAVALVELAKGSRGDRSTDRPTVLLSVNEQTLAGSPGADTVAGLSSGGFVGVDTALRLSCDSRSEILYKDDGGAITAIAPGPRSVTPALRRAVEERDGGRCTFPGCEREIYLECHHIIHRAQGGPNVASNLLLLCWTHHTLVHEGGWSLRGEAGPRVTWVRPDGTPFEPRVRVVLDTS